MRSGVILCAAILAASASAVFADALPAIRGRGTLIWGGDQEGGGPFIFPVPDDPQRVTGFEVELAGLVATELGVRPSFFQADWNTLPEFLRSGRIDLILNGYEWSADRAANMLASRPYYIYELQLLARQDEQRLRGWGDLNELIDGRRWSISVLGGTSAANLLSERYAETVEVVEYNGNTDAMAQVRGGVHDATVADLPVAIFYRKQPQAAGLKFVAEPVEPGYYVIYARRDAADLIEAVNGALSRALADGRLKQIYDRYELWTPAQERLAGVETPRSDRSAARGWGVVERCGPLLVHAAWVTVQISVLAMPLAIAIGIGVALMRLYGPAPLRFVAAAYVEVLRGTPVMLQLYVIYFLLPTILPFSFQPLVAAVIGLAINYSAYESEIYRAGIQAIPEGQMQAALALGFSKKTAIRRVILPQAMRIVIPPVTNDFVALFKDTSVCSVIAVTELTKQYNISANSTGAILEIAAMTAALYMLMSFPLSRLAGWLESRLGVSRPVA